jgi:hypothetical protein
MGLHCYTRNTSIAAIEYLIIQFCYFLGQHRGQYRRKRTAPENYEDIPLCVIIIYVNIKYTKLCFYRLLCFKLCS